MKNPDIKRRILDISYKKKLSHIGSCLGASDIINNIYETKKDDEPFILSSGHAGLALYCVLEKYKGLDAEKIFDLHGVHPDRCKDCQLDCSAGSLGHGIGIALGMALADRKKNVYVLLSDGECAEGSVWESLRIAYEQHAFNLKIYVNINGWGAYGRIDEGLLTKKLIDTNMFVETNYTDTDEYPFLNALDAHYYTMNDEDYEWVKKHVI